MGVFSPFQRGNLGIQLGQVEESGFLSFRGLVAISQVESLVNESGRGTPARVADVLKTSPPQLPASADRTGAPPIVVSSEASWTFFELVHGRVHGPGSAEALLASLHRSAEAL